jgi:hypothetical protein
MKRGVWHQMGYNSQKLIIEQLQNGNGVGVIISPRYLPYSSACEYAKHYADNGAAVLHDPEFYVPDSSQGKLGSYPSAALRASASALMKIADSDMDKWSLSLEEENRNVGACAVVAPALPYEAGRSDLVDLNARLFKAAKRAGDVIGVPTLATVVVGQSGTTPNLIQEMLSAPTALPADGWFYQFEFQEARLPKDEDEMFRFCVAALTLACTDKPLLHSCAGPMSLLSFAVGATGSAITFRQNLWGFERSKWLESEGQGGGGSAPARFFSGTLWGTIVQPDELILLPASLRTAVLTHSPYSNAIASAPSLPWDKWAANKHMVQVIAAGAAAVAKHTHARDGAHAAIKVLSDAITLHSQIAKAGIVLKDETNSYQVPWAKALQRALKDNADDYQWLADIGR